MPPKNRCSNIPPYSFQEFSPTAYGTLPTVAYNVGEHLTSVARQGDLYPAFVGFLADKRPQLVEFEHEVFGRWRGQQGS